jgi:hypothetical protein
VSYTEDDLETARAVLAAASLVDPRIRKPDPAVARAWAAVLSGVDRVQALEAVRRHYAASSEVLMPADVRRLARESDPPHSRTLSALPRAPGTDAGRIRRGLAACRASVAARLGGAS